MDEWGLDVVASGAQKGYMLSTGALSFVAMSARAWEAYERSDLPKFLSGSGPLPENGGKGTATPSPRP